MNVTRLAAKAENSSFYRWLLSQGLNTMVPFNRPHSFRVEAIGSQRLKVRLPYKKRNCNHLKGLHACALATLAEISSGFLLVTQLDPSRYRLILHKLEMEYYYQGRMDAIGEFSFTRQWLENTVMEPLEKEEVVRVPCEVKIHDTEGNHLATGIAHWQIKNWSKVRTR